MGRIPSLTKQITHYDLELEETNVYKMVDEVKSIKAKLGSHEFSRHFEKLLHLSDGFLKLFCIKLKTTIGTRAIYTFEPTELFLDFLVTFGTWKRPDTSHDIYPS